MFGFQIPVLYCSGDLFRYVFPFQIVVDIVIGHAECHFIRQRRAIIFKIGRWRFLRVEFYSMDFKTEANIIRALGKIIGNGHLHKGAKPVHWCVDCRSALAEAEVEYYDKTSPSIDVAFQAVDQDALKTKFGVSNVNGPISLVIWTTTPWTLPANRAISIAPDFDYALVQIDGQAVILAKDLVESVMQRIGVSDYTILGTVKGAELELLRFTHPFMDFDVPAILGDHVTLDAGTGAVHTAPGHGRVEFYSNENTKAIPLISYEGDSFYVRQTTLGFILSQSEKNELSLTASWMPLEFDPADNDDYAMQQLDKRDSTAMAGVAWYHHERWGTVKASAAADVLDNSNGWVGELSVFHKMQIGRLSLTPALGVLYYDENFSDYYYGISESESRRSGLASYSAQDAWVPYVSLTAKYPIVEHVVLMASAGYSELPEEITDSPMIDRNESFTFVTGVSWRF